MICLRLTHREQCPRLQWVGSAHALASQAVTSLRLKTKSLARCWGPDLTRLRKFSP